MGKELDKLIDLAISNSQEYSKLDVKTKDLVEEKLKSEVLAEIKQEVSSKAIKDAKSRLDEERAVNKLRDYKELTVVGIVLAFLIGLSVNQVSDFIGYIKNIGKLIDKEPWVSVAFALIIIVICIVIINCGIFKEINNLSKDKKV